MITCDQVGHKLFEKVDVMFFDSHGMRFMFYLLFLITLAISPVY